MVFSLNSTPQPRYSRPTGENKKRRRPPGAAPAPKKRRFLPKTQQEQGGHRLGGHRSAAKPPNFGASPPPPRGASAAAGSGPCSWLPKKFGLRRREEKRAKSPAQSGHRVWNVKNPGEQNQGVDGTTKIKIKNKQRSVNENQEEGQGAPPQKKARSSRLRRYFLQVRCGVCFFCTSSRQRLRSSSQGSSKFLRAEVALSTPRWHRAPNGGNEHPTAPAPSQKKAPAAPLVLTVGLIWVRGGRRRRRAGRG